MMETEWANNRAKKRKVKAYRKFKKRESGDECSGRDMRREIHERRKIMPKNERKEA